MAGTETLNLPNRFDYSHHRKFDESYASLLSDETCKEIILDFSRVEYIDSAAIGMIVLLQKKCTNLQKIAKIKGAYGATVDILDMAHMQKLFEFI
ncbi:MAG: anti-sigma factor antagonist [Gammaproteobacteria bacterium]|nr:MAG: anti-sigma factor antagonist [Gammaproteobacteria bacterium]